MTTGNQQDVFTRIKALIPRWFGDDSPVLDALLQGAAYAGAFAYQLIGYATLQTRIKTATGGWLDLIASDFFGVSIRRLSGQSDASFRAKIITNLFRERATRRGLIAVLTDLTGRAPLVFEPLRPLDTGAYGMTGGYGVAGGYGSVLLPYQAFVTAYRPASTGIPMISGYGSSSGGYGVASRAEYASIDMIQGGVTDADIYAAVDSVKPVGTVVWTQITN